MVDAHSPGIGFVVDEFDVDVFDGLLADDGLVDVFLFEVQVEFELGHKSFVVVLKADLDYVGSEPF